MANDDSKKLDQVLELERAQREDLKLLDHHLVSLNKRILGANIIGFVLFALLCATAAYLVASTADKRAERRRKADVDQLVRLRRTLKQWKTEQSKTREESSARTTLLTKLMDLYHRGENEKALELLPKAEAAAHSALEHAVVAEVSRNLNRKAALAALARGISDYQRDKPKDAIKHLLQALKYAPHGSIALQAHYYAGLSYHKRQDYRKAAQHLGALATDPAGEDILDDAGLFRLGHAHDLLKQSQAARKYYGLLIERYPKSVFAPVARAKLRQLGGP